MTYEIKAPSHIDATVSLPASKSISNRALIIHALSGGRTMPDNLSDCDDTNVIVAALRDNSAVIDIGAAGTAMRFMTAYLSVTAGEHVITGTERMKHRPIYPLVDALRKLGADIQYTGQEGFPPLCINGQQLEGGKLSIEGNVSSQYISALLMIGPMLAKGLELRLTGEIVSRPYIDLTLHIMHEFGVAVEWTNIDTITVAPQHYADRHYLIENDWSAASYWYEMLALLPPSDDTIVLPGLMNGSRQGDAAVRHLYNMLGIRTTFLPEGGISLRKHASALPRLDYDFTNQPDLAQTLVTTCAALEMPFHFTGLASLKIKETDRIEALKNELRKLGYVIKDANDSELSWDGERCEPQPHPAIDTYEDHRMAMAFAPLAIRLGSIAIRHPQVVTKSYPRYWDDLKSAGFTIIENP